jgi:hypothetical protein
MEKSPEKTGLFCLRNIRLWHNAVAKNDLPLTGIAAFAITMKAQRVGLKACSKDTPE